MKTKQYATAADLPPGVTTISATRLRKLLDDEAIVNHVEKMKQGTDLWYMATGSVEFTVAIGTTPFPFEEATATFRQCVQDAIAAAEARDR